MKIISLITEQKFRRTLMISSLFSKEFEAKVFISNEKVHEYANAIFNQQSWGFSQSPALRNSSPKVSYKKVALNNFKKFTGNEVCWNLNLTLKRLGGQFDPSCDFSKNVSFKERVKPWKFIEIPQVVQKLWRISMSILAIFIDFHQFSGFFYIFLLQRN